MSGRDRFKIIILDKAPAASGLLMQTTLGYNQVSYQELVDAFNQEFGKNISVSDIDTLNTFDEVVSYLANA